MDSGSDTNLDDLVALAQKRKASGDGDGPVGNKKSKKHKGTRDGANKGVSNIVSATGSKTDADDSSSYPYPVTADDHCESPLEAYRDISSFLLALCAQLGKTPATLAIFDPYYCEGSMKERLRALGFENVRNEKKDFYELIRTDKLPPFDVLVTNPPYSSDHMERLLRFCTGEQCRRPWFLLVPNYVYTKDYYASIFGGGGGGEGSGKSWAGRGATSTQANAAVRSPFYVTPEGSRRYLYTTPKGRRQEKSGKYTSPFPTFWYCQVYEQREKLLSQAAAIRVKAASAATVAAAANVSAGSVSSADAQVPSAGGSTGIVVAINSQAIPLQHAPDNDPRKRKLRNNKKRSKNKQRQKGDKA